MFRKGMSLVEVLVAATVLTTVVLGMALFQTASLKSSSQEKDRAFAMQKAIQIMEEALAFQVTAGTDPTKGVDTLSDGDAFNFTLTTDPKVSDPKMALSGNSASGAGYKFVRQITVEPMPNEKGARRITVAVYYGDGNSTPGIQPGKTALASVVNIVKAGAVKSQPTQVYDLFIVGIENVGGNRFTLEQMIMNTLDQCRNSNPGLDFRVHYIRKLAYGRDPYYAPAFNTSGWLVDYSGYNPNYLGGQMIKAGGRVNGIAPGTTVGSYYTNVANYAYADQFNHPLRQPEEEEKYAQGGKMSLRMLLERMARGELRNAIIVNMHEETTAVPALRNYSDAAKVPDYLGNKSYIQTHFGVSPANDTEIDDGARARVVVHPRRLQYDLDGSYDPSRALPSANDTVELDVFPYLSRNTTVEPNSKYRTIQIVLRGVAGHLTDWNQARRTGPEEDVEVQALQRSDTTSEPGQSAFPDRVYFWSNHTTDRNHWHTTHWHSGWHTHYALDTEWNGYMWQTIWPDSDRIEWSTADVYNPELASWHGADIQRITRADASKDLQADDLVITLKNVPFTHLPVQNGTSYSGLPANQRMYGYNYFPDPKLPYMDSAWPNGATGTPRNTARFRIRFKVKDAGRYEVLTTLGADDHLQAHQFPNRSRTWVWAGQAPPFSEQYTIVGDPRCIPYEDARVLSNGATSGNRFFANFTTSAYKNGGGSAWDAFPATDLGWGPQQQNDADVPRYFELWRRALLGSNSIYQSPIGFSHWAYGLGYDTPPLYEKKDDTWNCVPWLGELYPDDQWATWMASGNLPTSGYRFVDFTGVPSWMPNGGANPTYDGRSIRDKGCVSFFNGGTAGNGSNWFTHYYTDTMSNITPLGDFMSAGLKLSLDPTFRSRRAFRINATDMTPPQDWNSGESGSWRTQLSWGIPGTPNGYYAIDNSLQAAAPFVMRRGGQTAYAVMVTGHWADYSGSTLLARLCVSTALQTFFDMAYPSYADGSAKGDNAVKLVPRVSVTSPAEDSSIDTRSVRIQWQSDWSRWDTTEYSKLYTNSSYQSNRYRPNLGYHVKYSTDGGNTWKFAGDNSNTARGVWDGNHAISGNSYTWDVSRLLNNREYLVRVECFRSDAGYTGTHYAFHQVPYTMAHP